MLPKKGIIPTVPPLNHVEIPTRSSNVSNVATATRPTKSRLMAERGGRLVRAENKRWKMHDGSEDDNEDTNVISLFMSRLVIRLDAGA